MKLDKSSLLLYAVTDRRWLNGKTLLSQVQEAVEGGATFVQLREKELDAEAFMEESIQLKELCRKHSVPFVINDSVEIAKKTDADGVHIGQSDMELIEARKLLGPEKIIGVSAETVEEAVLAEKNGADYIGVGAVFPTGSKDDALSVSRNTLSEICRTVKIPVVAIGGINASNAIGLAGTGICGIAVISAIFAQPDIRTAAKKLKSIAAEIAGTQQTENHQQ